MPPGVPVHFDHLPTYIHFHIDPTLCVWKVGNLFPAHRSTIITLYNGAFDSSSAVFFIIKVKSWSCLCSDYLKLSKKQKKQWYNDTIQAIHIAWWWHSAIISVTYCICCVGSRESETLTDKYMQICFLSLWCNVPLWHTFILYIYICIFKSL